MTVRLSALGAGRPLPPGRFLVLSRTHCHSAAGRIRSIEKSNDLMVNRTRDLLACSIVPQHIISTEYWSVQSPFWGENEILFCSYPPYFDVSFPLTSVNIPHLQMWHFRMCFPSKPHSEWSSDLYSGGARFESRPVRRLSWQIYCGSSIIWRTRPKSTQIRPRPLPFELFLINHSFVILPFDSIHSAILKASLNNQYL
jgi:hypothetical protein